MKTLKFKTFTLFVIVLSVLSLNSCKKDINEFLDEQFPEKDSISDDIFIDGELAAPIVNSKFTLKDFVPEAKDDSSLWAEVDENDFVHLKMYDKNIMRAKLSDIYTLPLPATIAPSSIGISTEKNNLEVYDNAISGKLFFKDPKFTFIVKNHIPLVSFIRLDTIRMHINDNSVTYKNSGTFVVTAPQTTGGVSVTKVIIDNNVLPGFSEFFSPVPQFISTYITVGSDVAQTLPPTFPTVTGNEEVTVDLDIDLPLEASVKDITFGDTSKFDMDTSNNVNQIKEVTLKIIIDNEFPLLGEAQIIFADTAADGSIKEHLVEVFEGDGFKFESALVEEDGTTKKSVRTYATVVLSQEQVDKLVDNNASKIIFKSKFNSLNSDQDKYIKIYGWYKLGVKIGVKIKFSGNTSDLNN